MLGLLRDDMISKQAKAMDVKRLMFVKKNYLGNKKNQQEGRWCNAGAYPGWHDK